MNNSKRRNRKPTARNPFQNTSNSISSSHNSLKSQNSNPTSQSLPRTVTLAPSTEENTATALESIENISTVLSSPMDNTDKDVSTSTHTANNAIPLAVEQPIAAAGVPEELPKFIRFIMDWENRAKMLIMRRTPSKSIITNFFLIIYLLYYRYTIEFGVSIMTFPEALVCNTAIAFLAYAIIVQATACLTVWTIWFYRLLQCAWWAYNHIDEWEGRVNT